MKSRDADSDVLHACEKHRRYQALWKFSLQDVCASQLCHGGHSFLPDLVSCAAAKQLKQREAELQRAVLLIFQPAEEGLGGGKIVAESGALKGVKALHGLHVWPDLQSGVIASKAGTQLF